VLRSFLEAQSRQFDRVLLVPGNHEYWETTRRGGAGWLHELAIELGNVELLDRGGTVVAGYRVVGATLWTRIPTDPVNQGIAAGSMRDFHRIGELSAALAEPGGVAKALAIHREWYDQDVGYLMGDDGDGGVFAEAAANGERLIVLTHHAPSQTGTSVTSVALGWSEGNNFEEFLKRLDSWSHIKAWCFGHTHFNVDRQYADPASGHARARLVSNQRGHPGQAVAEGSNPFNPDFVLELPA
jgi:hypothetical protein